MVSDPELHHACIDQQRTKEHFPETFTLILSPKIEWMASGFGCATGPKDSREGCRPEIGASVYYRVKPNK